MKIQAPLLALITACLPQAQALSPGDLMFTGYVSDGSDAFTFVTWVELPANEELLFMDGEFDGGGDGSGEGIGGGYYTGNRTIEWTNTTGATLPVGTVVLIDGLSNNNASTNLGTVSGGFGLTNQGEQIFIAQGSIADDNGNDYLDGQLIFGLDYEGSTIWGESGESDLPGALNVAGANISFGAIDNNDYTGTRDTLAFSAYPVEILNSANWTVPVGGILLDVVFEDGSPPPPVPNPDLGQVQGGLLFHPRRLNNGQPIIDEAWMLAEGSTAIEADNINGASCIRLPNWLPANERAHPSAVYYLYFADHNGNYIRMAWAANLEGPWSAYRMDTSLFSLADRGVLSLGSNDENTIGNGIIIDGHVASPQVFVDDVNQEFRMYYHAPTEQDGEDRGQSTLVATSSNGLNFNQASDGGQPGHGTLPVILGESYFRVFEHEGRHYAFSNTGDLWAAPEGQDPFVPPSTPAYDFREDYWDRGPNLFTDLRVERGFFTHEIGQEDPTNLRPRHFAVHKRDNVLYAFLTYKEDRPERIVVATFDLDSLPASHLNWSFQFPEQELMQAAIGWEGGQFPPLASNSGSQDDGVNQLRDPGAFQDSDGRLYLFYSGQGEDAIGLAQLVAHPQVTGPTEVTTGQTETFTIATETDVTPEILRVSQSTPVAVEFDAESGLAPLIYDGNSSYSAVQSATVDSGAQAYQLAHFAIDDDETLTFPSRYYATEGASVSFQSRLAASTFGQIAELQVSFDGNVWQSLWRQLGSTNEGSFNTIDLDLDGLVGRAFHMRLRYFHQSLRETSFTSGAGSNTGWFIDGFVAEGLEEVVLRDEQAFTANTISLDELSPILSPHLSFSDELEDRFLLEADGLHSLEETGFGKPFVIRVRSSYEDFLDTFFTASEQDDLTLANLTADPDGDGLSNLAEHVFGYDPRTASLSPLCIESDGNSNPQFKFPWNPEAGYQYTLQMSTDLEFDGFADIPSTEEMAITLPGSGLLELTIIPDFGTASTPNEAFFRLRVGP